MPVVRGIRLNRGKNFSNFEKNGRNEQNRRNFFRYIVQNRRFSPFSDE